MRQSKRAALEAQGWAVGSVDEFLGLTPEESALVELKLRLSDELRVRRAKLGLSQHAVAQRLSSSQSRVAKMEAADASVSLDLLFRALIGLGATTAQVARIAVGDRERAVRMQRSSGNVFTDLGFPTEEAAHLLIRADLMIDINRLIKKRGLTQRAAAKVLGVTQPRVSALVRGRIDLFSIDALVEILARLGMTVTLTTKRRARVA